MFDICLKHDNKGIYIIDGNLSALDIAKKALLFIPQHSKEIEELKKEAYLNIKDHIMALKFVDAFFWFHQEDNIKKDLARILSYYFPERTINRGYDIYDTHYWTYKHNSIEVELYGGGFLGKD